MNSLITLLLCFQGCYAFTAPSINFRRATFVSKPFFATTELQSDETPAGEAVSEAAPIVEEAAAGVDADEVVSEAVEEAVSEIVEEAAEVADAEGVVSEAVEEAVSEVRVLRERHTVFLGNLPFELTKEEIGDLCAEYGEIRQIAVPLNRETGLPRGFAFVDMSSSEEAEKAIDNLDGSLFKGRSMRASISDPSQKKKTSNKKPQQDQGISKVYVGNLPFETNREDLLDFYKGFVDAVEAYVPVNADTGAGRGFAFVSVKTEDVDTAIEKTNGMEYEGRPLVVNRPLPPGQKKERSPLISDRTKLYVGNLAFSTDVEILAEVFGEFGEVLDSYMPEDPVRGGSRGFGFVTMARDNALEAVTELDGCELDGRFIRVNEAMPKGKSPPVTDEESSEESGDDEL